MSTLPRPGTTTTPTHPPIRAPPESSFTDTFGSLLPPAAYLDTELGRAAYYVFDPLGRDSATTQTSPLAHTSPAHTSPSARTSPARASPTHVLLIHGVQTPALGLYPLTTALRTLFPATTFALLDLWGHGLSDTPIVPHETALFSKLVGDVLGALGWDGEDLASEVGIVGFSFGAVVGMQFLVDRAVEGRAALGSAVLVAPAGLMRGSWFSEQERGWLGRACDAGEEEQAADWVVRTLEGGELVVPGDWRERVRRGEVVAEKLREWQMVHHAGHKASVVGIFRDGGVLDNQGLFVKAKETGTRALVVLGGEDDLSTEEEIVGFGFDVRVVEGAGHGVVRDRAGEVAEYIAAFWEGR